MNQIETISYLKPLKLLILRHDLLGPYWHRSCLVEIDPNTRGVNFSRQEIAMPPLKIHVVRFSFLIAMGILLPITSAIAQTIPAEPLHEAE